MDYHWEGLSADQLVLFEEGATQTRWNPMPGVGAEINKIGPYMGNAKVTYRADGPLVDPPQDFDSLEEATSGVEEIVRAGGRTVDGL